MNKKRYINLQLKITLIIFIILLALNVLIGIYLASNVKKKSMLIVKNYVKTLPLMVDRAINNFMANGDKGAVKELVHRLSKDENILGIHIFGKDRDINCSYSSFATKYNQEYISSIYDNFLEKEGLKLVKTKHLTFYSYYKPYENVGTCKKCHTDEGNIIGVLNINVDVNRITKIMSEEATKVIVTLVIFSIILTGLLSYLINRLIVHPLQLIENGMKEVAHNNLNVSLKLKTRDEIERLAKYFNFMVSSLRKANYKIDTMHRNMLHVDRLTTIGQLMASISHEIKNPLNSIMINTDLLMHYCEKMGDGHTKRLVEGIIIDAERIRGIIDQTLRFSKYSPNNVEVINLEQFMKDIETYARRILFDKDYIKFEISKVGDWSDCKIKISRIQLEQVFINLIKNAIDAVEGKDDASIKLVVDCLENEIVFQFIDNGVGIPKDVQEKIFNEFYTTKKEGTGMGLSIVREIIDANNGKIEVISEEGVGTTFKIYLPRFLGEENDQ
ncbi:HAMP domain-containing histidine kinase [Deferribacter autotrophicus]|uniref:histidine kinase n=1 Tax=Deferribacter autotrophicus TaxID=500465 RepID=A0A5A8F7V1_9BACT|nr:HAMP domain-containing sensor histidine kinase [Deferribacter autotrophicus]KAA0259549.1 HAMP domain-containing histidine kinase [Deferribacter autotrophicus]